MVLLHWRKPIVFEWDNNTGRGEQRDLREQQTVLPNVSNTVLHASKMIGLGWLHYEFYNLPRALGSSRETAAMNYLLSQRELTDWFASEFYFRTSGCQWSYFSCNVFYAVYVSDNLWSFVKGSVKYWMIFLNNLLSRELICEQIFIVRVNLHHCTKSLKSKKLFRFHELLNWYH